MINEISRTDIIDGCVDLFNRNDIASRDDVSKFEKISMLWEDEDHQHDVLPPTATCKKCTL